MKILFRSRLQLFKLYNGDENLQPLGFSLYQITVCAKKAKINLFCLQIQSVRTILIALFNGTARERLYPTFYFFHRTLSMFASWPERWL